MKLKLKLKAKDPAENQPSVPFSNPIAGRVFASVHSPEKVERMIEQHSKQHPPDKVPYNQWFYSENQLPPDVNEDIVVWYPEKKHYELARSFVLLQNVFYRKTEGYEYEPFHWLRFRGVHGNKEHYPQ